MTARPYARLCVRIQGQIRHQRDAIQANKQFTLCPQTELISLPQLASQRAMRSWLRTVTTWSRIHGVVAKGQTILDYRLARTGQTQLCPTTSAHS